MVFFPFSNLGSQDYNDHEDPLEDDFEEDDDEES